MTESACNCLDRNIVQTTFCVIVAKLDTVWSIEVFNLSEGTTGLFALMPKCKGTSVATRKDPVSIGSKHRVD
jgi:hypothetical protein